MARKKAPRRRVRRTQFRLTSPDMRPGGTISMEQMFNGFGDRGRRTP